jgi:hypothetical protein
MPNINTGILDGVRRIGAKFRELTIDGGIPGAPLGMRIRGATTSGPPTTGSWRAGDEVSDRTGIQWTCTVSGTPGTWAGTAMASGTTMTGYLAPAVTALSDGTSVAINAANGNVFTWSLGAASHTLSAPTNPVNGQVITIDIAYSGSYTPLFNAIYDFGTPGAPTWTASSGKTDSVSFRYSALKTEWLYQGSVLGL